MEIFLGQNQKVEARHKGFVIETDQPTKAGGDNEAPAPFDLFLASIGTCAGFYVKSFCRQRKISEENIKIKLTTQRDPQKAMIGQINIDIYLPESFPTKYKDAIIKSAEQCSVKKHIFDPPEFTINSYIGEH